MDTTCKYCNQPENKQDRPGLICENCICFVHLGCLRRPGTPGDFSCDVFFDYTCGDCSENKIEVFTRNKFPWVNVILLTLHHLSIQSYGLSNNGYFHYKTHICSFIDRYWCQLFGQQTKQKKNWVGTIAGVLSVYNNLVFRSGSMVLGETGWWKLMHGFSPAVAAHIIQRDKPKGRPRSQLAMDKVLFIGKVTEMGYQHLINSEDEPALASPEPTPAKKKRLDHDSVSSCTSLYDQFDSDSRTEAFEYACAGLAREGRSGSPSDSDGAFRGFHFTPALAAPQHYSEPAFRPQSDSSSINSLHQVMYYESDSHSPTSNTPAPPETPVETKPKKPAPEEKPFVKRESLFSTELNSVDLPWVDAPKSNKELVELTQYEEIQLLKQMEGMIPTIKDPKKKAYLCMLKAKLALRRLKRHKHLPIFDLDKFVKLLGGYLTEDSREVTITDRVLDRFQRSYLVDNLCGTIAGATHSAVVVPRVEAASARSAYSGVLLKPYVRRDAAAAPLWLRLQDELLRRTHRHVAGYSPPARATLDYSYVRPQHVPALNSLCAQHFWPGIDLTEALQYPEFSCVVTYRRLVVACAFLVPDAGAGRAYISFVLVRPEWRRAGIASFMLYHLLQTCSSQDVTLHVSPTNPAIFLYQKFGFKVEELVQDFYEKYYDMDYKGCRHALFLRLIR